MDPDYCKEPFAVKVAAVSLNSIFLTIWTGCLTFAMLRIKCGLEKSGYILIVLYSINAVLRVIFDGLRLGIKVELLGDADLVLRLFMLIQRMVDHTFIFIVYRYILEMREVRNKLQCHSFEDYKRTLPG